MWNYSYVLPSLLILVVFMGYYLMLPRIPIRLNRTFLKIVLIEAVVMIADFVSTWACINYEILPGWILYFLNDLYFVSFYIRAYMFFLFTATVLRLDLNTSWLSDRLVQIPVVLVSLITLTSSVTHLIFYFDAEGYHSGPLYNILYFVLAFYLIASFVFVVSFRDKIRRKREFNSCVWYNFILLLGSVIRYVFPTYLLMDTFCLIALIVIYLSFENPDFYLEGRSWIFNSKAFREYLEEIVPKKNFCMLQVVIHNYRDNRELYGVKQMDQGIHLIGDYMRKTFKHETTFYYRSGRFLILGDEDMDWEKYVDTLKKRYAMSWKADEAELFLDFGAAILKIKKNQMPIESLIGVIIDSFEMASELEGGEVVEIDDSILESNLRQSNVKRALNNAIEHDQVMVYLQPIFSSSTGKIIGAEALARIRDKDGEIIPPEVFIPIAEKSGMINKLGEQVFAKTCRFIKEYNPKRMGLEWINVNLSPIQFMRRDIAARLLSYTNQFDVDPEFIHLEITEEIMVDNLLLKKQMQALSSKGFKFVLDDYGKGYSNITRLKHCPFINIKLDMSIVWDYCNDPDDIIPNMVEAFDKIGFDITAEGIETSDMREKMAAIGVTYLQGFLFSKPIPIDEFIKNYSAS